jgi:signal transduction histidine kinase
MRLTAKLILICLALMTAVTLIIGFVIAHREWSLLETEHEETASSIAETCKDSLIAAWRKDGEGGVVEAVRRMGGNFEFIQVRWSWFQSPEKQAEMGEHLDQVMARIVAGEMETIFQKDGDNSISVHTYIPILNEDAKIGGLDISDTTDTVDRRTKAIWWTMFSAIAATFLLSIGLIALVGVRFVGRPLEKLVKKTEQIAIGDFTQPLELGGNDEFDRLAQALNQMCVKLTEQQNRIKQETDSKIAAMNQLRHHDRLQTVGQLSSGVAHELGTPLNVILGHADLIASQKMSPEETIESADTIKSEVTRMSKIVRQLMDFSRSRPVAHHPFDLNKLCRETIELLHSVARKANVNLLFNSKQANATVNADEEQLKQVFINLIVNAIQAMPAGGNVSLTLDCLTGPLPSDVRPDTNQRLDDFYCVEVRDQGTGMTSEQMERIFEPFYTTKEIGQGTGLGLSIAYGIVKDHDGWIDVSGEPGCGSSFRIFLPKEADR